jgi:hypothetical protein
MHTYMCVYACSVACLGCCAAAGIVIRVQNSDMEVRKMTRKKMCPTHGLDTCMHAGMAELRV